MTSLRADGRRFRVRSAGVAIRDGRVLVCRWDDVEKPALPGGGVEPGETSEAALVREMLEELGVGVRVGRLLWVVENHFTLKGERFHEIGFYWEMEFPASAECVRRDEVESYDGGVRMRLTWTPLANLGATGLVPSFLADGLADPPATTEFLVHVDGLPQT